MSQTTIPAHLVRRFRELGVTSGFGIVGDFALRTFGALAAEGFPIRVVTDEQGAGFAGDAYARLRGFGVVAVTYSVGGLKAANAVANAWAEQVPLLLVSGAPGVAERANDPMLHHRVKGFDTQLKVFTDLTCAQAVLDSRHSATDEIDRVIRTMLSDQRPGYIEIPRDMVDVLVDGPDGDIEPVLPRVDAQALRQALDAVMHELEAASTASIHAGVMVARRGLQSDLLALAETANIPVATSSLARGVFPERHPLGLGLYLGALSPEYIVQAVEDSEVLLSLGVLQTDLTLGAFTAHIDHERLILATDTDVTVGYRTFRDVPLWAFLPALVQELATREVSISHAPIADHQPFVPQSVELTVERAVDAISAHLDERHGLLLDPGEALFSSVDMRLPGWGLASGYYATMGYAVPGALGAGIADPQVRPVVIVGDGAFAMTGLEAGACAFHGVPAVILVFDNSGYGTQRPILDGPFNDIPTMAVDRLCEVFGRGLGFDVTTEPELDDALSIAFSSNDLCIVRIRLPREGRSAALSRLGAALAARA
ncbi:MAG: thiamine pyrophosphate-binding protein [Candidatus Nanopelagicales bacterium]|jgi:TPP-dependent 2-oxoacid decarboxylase